MPLKFRTANPASSDVTISLDAQCWPDHASSLAGIMHGCRLVLGGTP